MRNVRPRFLFLFLCVSGLAMAQNNSNINPTTSLNFGVVFDLSTWVGRMSNSCIFMALSDFYAVNTNYSTRLIPHVRDSKEDVVTAASAALDLLENAEVQAIIGPETSEQAEFIVNLGDKTQVPIISSSVTSPFLSNRTPYFVRATTDDSFQVKALATLVKAFGWKEVVPIYEDTSYGNGIIPYLTDALQEFDILVPNRSVIPPRASEYQITTQLHHLMTIKASVFIVHMSSSLGSSLFMKARELGMMSQGYVWIITDGLASLLDSMDSSIIDSMQGVLGIETYVPKSKELNNFTVRWKRKFLQDNPDVERAELSIFGLRAYDTITALAMAVERVESVTSLFSGKKMVKNFTGLGNLVAYQTGVALLEAISTTKFEGLCGEFHLIDGQLKSSIFQIVNVIGKGEREIGFWTPTYGISRELESTSKKIYSTSKDALGPIIWPGELKTIPKGWLMTGKILRVGVPVKDSGFSEFVKVQKDPLTNMTAVSGFCLDVFSAVMKQALPFVSYEYVPFENEKGQSAGNYDDLIYQVYLREFDAVVGDTTILVNRSFYVDFTAAYTDLGVSMIMPITKDERKKGWIFLKPLTMDLWLTTGAAFVFTGFVVWVLEHRINEEFRGSPTQQLGTIFWFSFSTSVFAHRERVASNLSRFVLIIWMLAVFVLTSSYTASLSSILTVQQLTRTNINDLRKNGDFVGYQKGSFVLDLLKRLYFDESKLKALSSPEEYDVALSKGSGNGGVSAIVDEIPYIKLFTAMYCAKYTYIGPIQYTDGFGFVFPKGSHLVPEVSGAISKLIKQGKIEEINKAWFSNQTTCEDQAITAPSSILSLDSFRGLFLITIIASTFALLVFLGFFFLEHVHILTAVDPENNSIWQRLVKVFKHFYQESAINLSSDSNHNVMNIQLTESRTSLSESEGSTRSPNTPLTQEISQDDLDEEGMYFCS